MKLDDTGEVALSTLTAGAAVLAAFFLIASKAIPYLF